MGHGSKESSVRTRSAWDPFLDFSIHRNNVFPPLSVCLSAREEGRERRMLHRARVQARAGNRIERRAWLAHKIKWNLTRLMRMQNRCSQAPVLLLLLPSAPSNTGNWSTGRKAALYLVTTSPRHEGSSQWVTVNALSDD